MLKTLRRKKKGQSTLEYIILVTGILVVIIAFLKPNGPFSQAFNTTITTTQGEMVNMANRLGGSHKNL